MWIVVRGHPPAVTAIRIASVAKLLLQMPWSSCNTSHCINETWPEITRTYSIASCQLQLRLWLSSFKGQLILLSHTFCPFLPQFLIPKENFPLQTSWRLVTYFHGIQPLTFLPVSLKPCLIQPKPLLGIFPFFLQLIRGVQPFNIVI